MAIVWLTSYPRSGNTWLRFLIQAYIRGGRADSASLNADVPDIHRKGVVIDPAAADQVLVKTHFPWSPRHPFAAQTKSFIYILRHPKDVLLSFLSYRKLGGVLAADDHSVDRPYAEQFIRGLGDDVWIKAHMGNWPQHIATWLARPAHPHVVVKYEDLLSEPERAMVPVLGLLGMAVDEARLRAAVEACRFGALRAMEAKEKSEREARGDASAGLFPGDPALAKRGVMFMNEGKSGRTLTHLGPDIEEAFDKAFAPYLSSLGYGPTAPVAG
ncbi:MAG: sulfotransferase domain-containing protein [Phycisphaerales bacterium]|nr:sulfotransferase domain-containing protein [Phycisphaerales bacterium]